MPNWVYLQTIQIGHNMKVLIAIEDKKFGKTIIDFVLKNKWNSNTKFKILHVIEPYELDQELDITYLPFLDETKEQTRKTAKCLVDNIAVRLKNRLVTSSVESVVLEGHAKEQLLDVAEKWKADLICLGTHGRKGLSRFLLGSVSQAVVSHAPCAVLVVKIPGHDKEAIKK